MRRSAFQLSASDVADADLEHPDRNAVSPDFVRSPIGAPIAAGPPFGRTCFERQPAEASNLNLLAAEQEQTKTKRFPRRLPIATCEREVL